MKKLIATTLVAVLAGVVANAQGTVNFANAGVGLNAPVFHSDGQTKLSGATFASELLAGPSSGSMAQVGAFGAFLTGGGAGFFNAGVVTIPTVGNGATGWFEVIAWDTTLGGTTSGATADQAFAYSQTHGDIWGASAVFSTTTGGPTPTPPATLLGLTSFTLNAVPEPSSLALVGLGAAALTILRRRK